MKHIGLPNRQEVIDFITPKYVVYSFDDICSYVPWKEKTIFYFTYLLMFRRWMCRGNTGSK